MHATVFVLNEEEYTSKLIEKCTWEGQERRPSREDSRYYPMLICKLLMSWLKTGDRDGIRTYLKHFA